MPEHKIKDSSASLRPNREVPSNQHSLFIVVVRVRDPNDFLVQVVAMIIGATNTTLLVTSITYVRVSGDAAVLESLRGFHQSCHAGQTGSVGSIRLQ